MGEIIDICASNAIQDGESGAFVITDPRDSAKRIEIMVVRKGGILASYLNSCPHVGSPLDFTPGQFLDVEKNHILCSTHGALFQIKDGLCIAGPCKGKALTALPVFERDDRIVTKG